ncbi:MULTISPECIES: hypothetical protein [Bradyrhizobium]|uniref:hypothetical protein n=1 Tax=Bradyrhizobium TaxID=374 RepID=UPI001ED9F70B|nr:hypothetical protein [Bradyrhizobium zhengyangense]MCG2645269.1 hypothetical protein [Bradyrhizobium zhengyangense]
MRKSITAGLCLLAFAVATGRCAAKECDPIEILIRDTASAASDQQRKLIKDTSKDTSTTNKESSSGGVNFFDIVSANGGQADEFSTSLREKFHLDFSSRDRRWETYTYLSDNAKEAYIACLKAQDQSIFILPSDNAMTSPEMSITVKLHPFVIYQKIPVKFSAQNAEIIDREPDAEMVPGGKSVINLKRDLDKSMNFKAKVGDQTEEITLPARQGFKLQRELRYSAGTTRYGHACDECHDTHPICVVLDNNDDAVVVPGTSRFIDIVHQEDGIKTTVNPVPKYSPKQACLQGAQTVGANNANANVCGYAVTEVIAKVPLNAQASAYAKQPAYVGDPKTCH